MKLVTGGIRMNPGELEEKTGYRLVEQAGSEQ